jgi:hypothetical protein
MRTLILIGAFLMTTSAWAAEFYAIVDSFGRKPLNAFMDVAVDSRSGGGVPPEIQFNIYDSNGVQVSELIATTQDGFASTFTFGNLFDLTNGGPLLVRARTPTAPNYGAVLHIDSRGAPLIIGVMSKLGLDGTPFGAGHEFSVPLGSFQKAVLLVANVANGDVGADVFKGTNGALGTGFYSNARIQNHGIWRQNLTQNEAFSNIVVASTGPIVVQVVIDDGKTIQSYMVPATR